MPIAAGAKLGPYEIVATLGAGGMGEVYRARDTRLERIVAIKVMAPGVLSFDNRGTLECEARAVAALNHPHICALHDLGGDEHTPFLVMEYVAGETLAARLGHGPLPPRAMIRYAIQIAEALDHAHRHGVIHRDLKPANIMLTKSGVKVLDFGLALLREAAPQVSSTLQDGAATAKLPLASERALFGTLHYMSPERLEGHDADAASDLFAFGAVMYEMATGRRPFDSDNPAGVIAAVLHAEPPRPSSIQPDVPPSVDWVIQKCLAKNPEVRWQSAADIVEVLRWIAHGSDGESTVTSRRRSMWPIAIGWVLAAAGLAAVMLAYASGFRAQAPEAPALTFSILPPPDGGFTPTSSSVPTPQFALSPNGRRLAFVAAVGHDVPQLWVRPLDSFDAEPLVGTQGAEYPFWSADGESIGFFANGSLKRIDLAGGPARVLAAAPHGRGGAWSRDDVILFAPSTAQGLFRIPATGGQAAPVTRLDAQRRELSHRWPQFLADDKRFLYFAQSESAETQGLYEAALDGASPPRKLVTSALSGGYVPPEHLLFVVDDELMATRFDWKGRRTLGEPFRVAAPVSGSSNFYAAFSVSRTGLLAFAGTPATSELIWIDRAGRRIGSVESPGEYVDFRLSPHDRQLALGEVDAQTRRPDIRVLDLERGAKIRVTYDSATDATPIWSPDGQRIVFRSNRRGVHDLYAKASNGAGEDALLLQSPSAKYPTDWMPDGRGIVYHAYGNGTGCDIWYITADGSERRPLVQTKFDEMQGQVSSDGRWLAYTSAETGSAEVYIRNLTDASTRWQVSAGGGMDPRWRADGRELFYMSADSWVTAVTFSASRPAAPRKLFQVRVSPPVTPYLSNYNVTADGRRFLVKVPVHDVTSTPIRVMANWLTSARRGSL